jgi:hypothetical protein
MKNNEIMRALFDAPYGTNLLWICEEGVPIGFHELTAEKEVTIREIVRSSKNA